MKLLVQHINTDLHEFSSACHTIATTSTTLTDKVVVAALHSIIYSPVQMTLDQMRKQYHILRSGTSKHTPSSHAVTLVRKDNPTETIVITNCDDLDHLT